MNRWSMQPKPISPENCDGHYFEPTEEKDGVIRARCAACGMVAAFTTEQWDEMQDA